MEGSILKMFRISKKFKVFPHPQKKKSPKNSPISNGRKDRKNLKDLKGSQRISKDHRGRQNQKRIHPIKNPPYKKKLNNEQHFPQRMTRATRIVRIIRISWPESAGQNRLKNPNKASLKFSIHLKKKKKEITVNKGPNRLKGSQGSQRIVKPKTAVNS